MFDSGTLQLAKIAGIPIRLHWSFMLIFLWVGYNGWQDGISMVQILYLELYVITLFFCVLLHEYGHALVARKFGHKTRDILLTPIGGIARLESISEKPSQEFWIAVAGPMVNMVIALILGIVMLLSGPSEFFERAAAFPESDASLKSFIPLTMVSNVILAVFNFIPAFPMDGGRILRALLSMKWSRLRSTWIAARIGQFLALVFLIFAATQGHWMLILVSIFIFFTAASELKQVQWETVLDQKKAGDLMISRFTTLNAEAPMAIPMELIQKGMERNFIVLKEGHIFGSLAMSDIIDAMKKNGQGQMIGEYTHPNLYPVTADQNLKKVLHQMQATGHPLLPVVHLEGITGVIDENQINKYVEIQLKTGADRLLAREKPLN